MPMTTKDPRALRHLAPWGTAIEGSGGYLRAVSAAEGYTSGLSLAWAEARVGPSCRRTRGGNLRYALYEIGPWQGSRLVVCEKTLLPRRAHSMAWSWHHPGLF